MDDSRAELSCTACRRLKRKCSKELPTCSLCKRVRRRCDYPTPTSSPDGHADSSNPWSGSGANARSPRIPGFNELASFASLQDDTQPSARLQHRPPLPVTSGRRFPAAWYLDSVGSRGMDFSIPDDLLWTDIVEFPVGPEHARLIAERYFEETHSWLPVVSKVRLRRTLTAAFASCKAADLAALLVAMDLLTGSNMLSHAHLEDADGSDEPGKDEDTIYQSLKAVMSACEQRGQFSTSFLAAQVLTAAYEVGKGLYPAAYLTVGGCVRVCQTIGLHNRKYATQLRSGVDTWNEAEERRRLWWASILLDRIVSVGFMFRPLAVPSIPPNEIIPGDDEMWDEGELSVNQVLIMSIESQSKVSPFARTCQAAHILGRVCDHVNEHGDPADVDFHFQEAESIQRAGEALLAMIRDELRSSGASSHRLFSAMALCCSALLAIYGTHSCIEIEPIESSGRNRGVRLEMQQAGIDGYQRIAKVILEFVGDLYAASTTKVSPFVLNCLYEAGCSFAWLYRENGREGQLEALQKIRGMLQALEGRWAVAGDYLGLLHDTENHYTGACSG